MAILQDKTHEELLARVAALEAQNEALKAKAERSIYIKITEKKAVGLYGIRRMPIVYYAQEWEKIFDCKEALESFIIENSKELSWKEPQE
jgi:hypothetical protein